MCKPTTEGGKRCAYHLQDGAGAALTTYTASVTGLGGAETREVMADLVAEFADAPAPSREVVDEFLEQQVFRARHEPDLTEKRRESIVRRLRNAIGRVTPDGATFKAWKNIVAEAWTRVRRKAVAAFLVGAMAFSVGACGTTSNEGTDPGRIEVVAAAPQHVTDAETPAASGLAWPAHKVTYKADAVQRYGRKEAEAGADLTLEVIKEFSFGDRTVAPTGNAAYRAEYQAWLLGAAKHMDTGAAKDWTTKVNTFMGGKNQTDTNPAHSSVFSLSSYGLMGPDNVPTDRPSIEDQSIDKCVVTTATDGRLKVEVTSSAHFNWVNNGEAGQTTGTRNQEFLLTQVGGQWKIDGWHGDLNIG